jgi:AraC-like DNA-binding protein
MKIANVMVNTGDGFERHRHIDEGVFEFHFFWENGGIFSNGGEEFPGKAGSLFFSRPEAWHEGRVERKGQRMSIYSVSFRPGPNDAELMKLVNERFERASMLCIGKGNVLAFEDLRRKICSRDRLQWEAANYRLVSFIYEILSGQTRDHRPRGQMYVDEALCQMRTNIAGSLDLDQLAGKLGIDKSYFIRLFKQVMGSPPLKYFLQLKMDAAAHSILSSNKSVRQVAADFGYADESYFSRVFKANLGLSPENFRARE